MFSCVQENIVANFLESKDIDIATKAVKDIKGPRYTSLLLKQYYYNYHNFFNLQGLNQEQLDFYERGNLVVLPSLKF